jgi:hypothetical protein
MKEADVLLIKVFGKSMFAFSEVTTFREIASNGLVYIAKVKQQEFQQFMADMLTKPEYSSFIKDPQDVVMQGLADKVPQLMLQNMSATFRSSVDSASLVFAHSILDHSALQYLRITALVAPDDWLPQIENRKVEIKTLRSVSSEDIIREKLQEYFAQLERESLLKKLDLLHAKCNPTTAAQRVQDYAYDRDRIEQLDNLRHQIIHGERRNPLLPNGDQDILYLQHTSIYLMSMVSERYGVKWDKETLGKGAIYP